MPNRGQCNVTIDGIRCTRAVRAKDQCGPHRAQFLAGNPYAKLRRREYRPEYRDEAGRKWCCNCQEWKNPGLFPSAKNRSDGLYTYCKACSIAKTRFNNFGMDHEAFSTLVASQSARCATCGSVGSLNIDHDHTCCSESGKSCGACVRGLLCAQCNTALGLVGDSMSTLLAMVEYLKKWEEAK